MARRVSSSQFRSKMRQLESQQRQAISRYNQVVRKYNQDVKRAVENYNQAVRAHNARVRANRQRINRALSKLQGQPTTARYTSFQISVRTLHETYLRLEETTGAQYESRYDQLLDLSEQENANSLEVMSALLGDGNSEDAFSGEDLQTTAIADDLSKIAPDLDNRWRGAVFSLHPRNPDAARHFCTSAREIFTQIFDIKAPDDAVFATFADCEITARGTPTRRAKIKYFLAQKGMAHTALEEFVDENVENILQLFRLFNDGTHGTAGRFDLPTLSAIKKRVEDGILYLINLVS
ncbi:MAG TPA: hypothetical protein PKD55_08755 [Bellilinea sp.]|mgnify:CR=1 FL=1|nr:hypothetical protein [Bellilinea sp.]